MEHPAPLFLAPLLKQLDRLLLDLLEGLSLDEWQRPTLAGAWRVRDVAAHLLDGNIRSLSMLRDQHFGEPAGEVDGYAGLVGFLNRLNADWIKAMRRVSPQLLVEMLALTGPPYCDHLASLDPFASATFSVAWAGEERSTNWFHVAREYTEKWHHQQQIRLAVGKADALLRPTYYQPYLETSFRALPHHYRQVAGRPGEVVGFHVTGAGGGTWHLRRTGAGWQLATGNLPVPSAEVTIPGALAWRIFTKGISRDEAMAQSTIGGDRRLAEHVFSLLAVMA